MVCHQVEHGDIGTVTLDQVKVYLVEVYLAKVPLTGIYNAKSLYCTGNDGFHLCTVDINSLTRIKYWIENGHNFSSGA